MKRFVADLIGAYRDVGRFACALPWILIAMIGVEIAQHLVEWQLGMFDSDAAVRKAASIASVRMIFGWIKMAAFFALGFYATRFAFTRDRTATLAVTSLAIRRYLLVAAFQAAIAAVVIYAGSLLALAGHPAADPNILRVPAGLFQQLAEPLLFLWYVSAAMGAHAYGPLLSARTTGWLYFWGLALMFVARMPLNALHQLLNRWPAGKAPAILWSALAVDAVVVGIMGIALAAVQVRTARYIAERRGIALLGEGQVG